MTVADREGVEVPGIDRLDPPRARFVWPAVLAVFTVTGVLRFTYMYFNDVARGETGTLVHRAIEEATGTYAAGLLFVGVVAFVWRFPVDRRGWQRRVVPHLIAMVTYSVAHTLLLLASRTVVFRATGMGAYDYGYMPARFLMEFGEDAISYATFVIGITLYRYYRLTRQREIRTAQLERSLAQAELRSLRLQLQPHFLFNALNTISSTMYDDPRSADRMVGQLSQLLRLSLRTSHAHEVVLGDELEVLACYLGLMHARFGARLRATVVAPPDTLDALVPSLLLQPLVENAIRHGNASHAAGGTIEVRVRRNGGNLELSVADDGPGAPDGVDLFAQGVGLSATRDRLRLLYGAAHAFHAGNVDHGFRVGVRLPYRRATTSPPLDLRSAPPATDAELDGAAVAAAR